MSPLGHRRHIFCKLIFTASENSFIDKKWLDLKPVVIAEHICNRRKPKIADKTIIRQVARCISQRKSRLLKKEREYKMNETYELDYICDQRVASIQRKTFVYLVHFKNYPVSGRRWIHQSSIDTKESIELSNFKMF